VTGPIPGEHLMTEHRTTQSVSIEPSVNMEPTTPSLESKAGGMEPTR
jgi:hypothetical protein